MPNYAIFDTEADWLAARTLTLGASDVGTIMGENPYKSAYTLWCEKTGQVEPFTGNIATRVGHALENLVTELYEEETGQTLHDFGPYTVFSHPDMPYFTCTPDRVIMDGERIVRAVELKTMSERAASALEGQVPMGYQLQLQTQIEILECGAGDLAILVGNRDFQIYPLERHPASIKRILAGVREFYERIINADPPPVDDSASTYNTIRALHPDDNGETVELSPDVAGTVSRMRTLEEQIDALEAEVRGCKSVLLDAIGDNTFAFYGGMKYSYKTQERAGKISVSLDKKERLEAAGIEHRVSEPTKTRVLRAMKG